jgi:predicted transcriptional regulator
MGDKIILLTIKKEFADQIFLEQNPKQTEYRKRPPRIDGPTRTIIYVSKEGLITGEFLMEPVSGEKKPYGFPLPIVNAIKYKNPLSWKSIRTKIAGIKPPQQNFRYLKPENKEDALLLLILNIARQPI